MIHSKLKKMVFALGILISPIYLQAQENSVLKLQKINFYQRFLPDYKDII